MIKYFLYIIIKKSSRKVFETLALNISFCKTKSVIHQPEVKKIENHYTLTFCENGLNSFMMDTYFKLPLIFIN